MGDDEYGMDYNEDYFGAEEQENADFAQDTDEHNMYPTEDGFWTNQMEDEAFFEFEKEVQKARLQDINDNPDPVNDWESDHFFGAE